MSFKLRHKSGELYMTINIRISETTNNKIKNMAKLNKLTRSEAIRQMIYYCLNELDEFNLHKKRK